jgi:hypothetical protein
MSGVSRSRRLSAAMGTVSESPWQMLILKKGKGEIVRPKFDDKPTVFRIFPGLDPDNPSQFDPWRFSAKPEDYGQWFIPVTCALNIGATSANQAKTWLLHDPYDQHYDINTNPLVLVRRAIVNAKKNKMSQNFEWEPLTVGAKGKAAEIQPPKECWLVRAAIIQHNGENYFSPNFPLGLEPDKPTKFVLLSKSAVDAVKAAMEEPNPVFNGDPEDINGRFINGDPVALDKGAFVVLFNKKFDPRGAASPASGQAQFARPAAQQGQDSWGSYAAYLTTNYHGNSPIYSAYTDFVRSHVKDWSEVLNVPTNEDQVKYLEQVLRPYPDLLVYALHDMYGHVMDKDICSEGFSRLNRTAPVSPAWGAPQDTRLPAGSTSYVPTGYLPQAPVQAPTMPGQMPPPAFHPMSAPVPPQYAPPPPAAFTAPAPVQAPPAAFQPPPHVSEAMTAPTVDASSPEDQANAMSLLDAARRKVRANKS